MKPPHASSSATALESSEIEISLRRIGVSRNERIELVSLAFRYELRELEQLRAQLDPGALRRGAVDLEAQPRAAAREVDDAAALREALRVADGERGARRHAREHAIELRGERRAHEQHV